MQAFEFDDYRALIRARFQSLPKHGRGELQKMANALKIHSTRISQILRGPTNLTPEQAAAAAVYLQLSELETEFFLALVNRERAGTQQLKRALEAQITKLRAQAKQMVHRLPRDKVIDEKERATFYSTWHYSAVRLLTSIPRYQTLEAIAEYFKLPSARVAQILEFLLASGLCVETSEGKVQLGPKRTHLENTSPLALRHHANWRLKAMQRHENLTDRELAYTGPMSLGPKEQKLAREELVLAIEKITKLAVDSEAEKVSCLNIDWFEF